MHIATEMTAKEFVLTRHPKAFIYDDGENVYVKVRETETGPCSHCGQTWTRDKHVDLMPTIGHAGSSERAWEDARKTILRLS